MKVQRCFTNFCFPVLKPIAYFFKKITVINFVSVIAYYKKSQCLNTVRKLRSEDTELMLIKHFNKMIEKKIHNSNNILYLLSSLSSLLIPY